MYRKLENGTRSKRVSLLQVADRAFLDILVTI